MLKTVTLKEIEKIFAVTERMGISRESVVIPLRTESPGHVSVLKSGKIEIVVDRDRDFDQWLEDLERQIQEARKPG